MHRLSNTAVLAALIALTGAGSVMAARPRADLPVNLMFRDTSGDGVRSDGGVYQHRVANVRAVLTGFSEGNLVFDTNDMRNLDGGRRLCLDFAGQLGLGFRCEDVFMPMHSINMDGTDDLRSLTYGQSYPKRMNINWSDAAAGLQYHVRWNGPDAGHTFVTVTCTDPGATKAGSCTSWTVVAAGTAGLYVNPLKGSEETYLGGVSLPHEAYIMKQ